MTQVIPDPAVEPTISVARAAKILGIGTVPRTTRFTGTNGQCSKWAGRTGSTRLSSCASSQASSTRRRVVTGSPTARRGHAERSGLSHPAAPQPEAGREAATDSDPGPGLPAGRGARDGDGPRVKRAGVLRLSVLPSTSL